MSAQQHDVHADLHSEQGALPGEHPGRARNPVVKVHDLAWLEFVKPDLAKAEVFAQAFGFSTVLRTTDELHLRGTDPGAPCVLIRRGPRSKFLGPAFRAADSTDVVRLSDATGRAVTKLPETLGGVTVDLSDPSGARVRVVSDTHDLPALPPQQPHTFNFGHDVLRANATQRPPREPAKVQRLGHVVLQTTKYRESLGLVSGAPRVDRQRLPLLPGTTGARPGDELHPLRSGRHPVRSPHAGDGAGPGQPVRALGLPGRRPGRAGGGRGVPA